ncbi:MAG TPA: hypothetical protein VF462_00310, partial [Micromonosporaceae bacterium]
RRYDLAGDLLATAIDRSSNDGVPIADAVRHAADAEGRRLAAAAADESTGGAPGGASGRRPDNLVSVARVLARHGYEPRISDREILLANCPFDRLATRHPALVCGMNLALIGGVIAGLDAPGPTAELGPQPGFCCVKIRG